MTPRLRLPRRLSPRDQDVHVFSKAKPSWWMEEWAWRPWVAIYRGIYLPATWAQSASITQARKLAKQQRCDLVIHGRNGRIRRKDSYGHDSPRRRG